MKKILTLLCVVLMATNAYAQLNVKSAMKSEPKKIMTLQMSYSGFYENNGTYFFECGSTNRFDNAMVFVLGHNIASSLQTAEDLKTLVDGKIAYTKVEQNGIGYTLKYQNNLGVEQLYIWMDGNAGYSYITKKSLEKIISYLKSI